MQRKTKMLLGISVALITAASLHFTVGSRFHQRGFGHSGFGHCGRYWNKPGSSNEIPTEVKPVFERRF